MGGFFSSAVKVTKKHSKKKKVFFIFLVQTRDPRCFKINLIAIFLPVLFFLKRNKKTISLTISLHRLVYNGYILFR